MSWIRSYPLVSVTLLVALVGGVAWAVGLEFVVPWLFSVYCLVVAGIEAVGMVKKLRRGTVGIDLLAIMAISATVAVGEYVASLIIVLMIAGGQALEDYAQGVARRQLTALLDREPQQAHRMDPRTDTIEDIPASEVQPGDRLLVRSGEMVPVDGVLVSATASFDESSLTGESLPVTRMQGGPASSGSINGNTAVTVDATALAKDSQYQAIVALVKEASADRAPIVRLADRYAVPFTIVSLLIAGVAWAISGSPTRFAEVLVLATPCPLLLAAPVAFMGGMSRAARAGIVVKGGGVLEQLARARTVVFDKTGTLTYGTPTISRIEREPGFDEAELMTLVASAEQASSHVLAASIVAEAVRRGITLRPVTTSTEVAAQGVRAEVDGTIVCVGTLAFIRAVDDRVLTATIGPGELAIYVAVDGRFAGTVIASDPVRDNAGSTIRELRGLGIGDVVMLTGDARATAEHVAGIVGISTIRADCLPADKVAAVRAIELRPVIMVGDGVNDSPVLAAADVGIAMGARGASAASESAGAVILVDDVSVTADAVTIARETVHIALQSIWLGIGLSVALMLVAATGVIPATVGAGVQEVVDLATILNALRAVRRQQ